MSAPEFFVALRSEAAAIRIGAPKARVVRFGMGERAARAAAATAASSQVDRVVVVCGFSGALTGELRPGEVVVATSLSLLGDDESSPLASASVVATALTEAGIRVTAGPIVTAPRLVSGREAREKAASGGAVAVDLESRWFAPLDSTRTVVVVRAIVDVPGKEVRSFSTPLAALRAGRSLARVARVLERNKWQIDIRTQHEQAGES